MSEKFKPLRFGTSGLRALVTEMTDMEDYINSRGFIQFLKERKEIDGARNVIGLGGDLRSSTPRIMASVLKAIEDEGCKADLCGFVPTPTLTYYAMGKGIPSVMVTGSHIPDDRNGIKFTKKSGEILKADEADILRNVANARKDEYSKSPGESLFDDNGMFKEEPPLPPAHDEAVKLYIERYKNVFPADALKGARIVLYQHSAVGRDILQKIFEALGAEVIPEGRSDKFIPVDTEKVSGQTRSLLKEYAAKHKPFAIISADGDTDRPLLADESGEFLPGDKLGALVSIYLRPSFAAIPISANDAVVTALEEKGVKVKQTKIGSPYVIKAMNDELARDTAAKAVGWESNGGFLTGSDWTINGKGLRALPSRDAAIALISSILLARQEGLSVSELIDKKLPHRYTYADVVDDKTSGCEKYSAAMGKEIVKMLSPTEADITQADFHGEKVRVHYADGKVKEAGPDLAKEIEAIDNKLSEYFTKERGFDKVASVNFVDGIRIIFANKEVSHIRPSGNAPEFRNYATADTPERAYEIVEKRKEIVPQIVAELSKA